MKKFINDPYDVVDEMVEGFLDVHSQYVRKLDTVRTLVRKDAPVPDKVGIVTGGGSGHKASSVMACWMPWLSVKSSHHRRPWPVSKRPKPSILAEASCFFWAIMRAM